MIWSIFKTIGGPVLIMLALHLRTQLVFCQPTGYPVYYNQSFEWSILSTGTEQWSSQEPGQKIVSVTSEGTSTGVARSSFVPSLSGQGTIAYSAFSCLGDARGGSVHVYADRDAAHPVFSGFANCLERRTGGPFALSSNVTYWLEANGGRGSFTVNGSDASATLSYPALISVPRSDVVSGSAHGGGTVNAGAAERTLGGFFAIPESRHGGSFVDVTYTLTADNPNVRLVFADTRRNETGDPKALIVARTILPVEISTQPIDKSASVGENVLFSVVASGEGVLAYQWYFGSSAIAGARGSELGLPAIQAEMSGLYSVVISNAVSAILSRPARLSVAAALPAVLGDPASQSVPDGAAVNLSVVASGSLPLSFQWAKDGIPMPGQNGASLVIPSAQLKDAGIYRARVVNAFGSAESREAVLKVISYAFFTLAGSEEALPGSSDGAAREARFNLPQGIAVDLTGNAFVSDYRNHTIRRISPDGRVSTIAGSPGERGNKDGPGQEARFYNPVGLTLDGAGNLFVADQRNNSMRKLSTDFQTTTIAGVSGTPGWLDGPAREALFNFPVGIAIDKSENLFLVDRGDGTVRKLSSSQVVTSLIRTNSPLYAPFGAALDAHGVLFISDDGNHAIRKIATDGSIVTVAGAVGQPGSDDGAAKDARFNNPEGIVSDADGNLFVVDSSNHTIRLLNAAGRVFTIGGVPGKAGLASGVGTASRFNTPTGIAIDSFGDLYIADALNHAIRKGIRLDNSRQGLKMENPLLAPDKILLSWIGLPGLNYQLQYSFKLEQGGWRNLGDPIVSNDILVSTAVLRQGLPASSSVYFRVAATK